MKLRSLVLALALAVPTVAWAAPPTTAELTACFGEGARLPVFDSLRRGMTPEEAAQVLPGADKVDKYGFAKVKAKDCVGAKTFVLFYMKDKTTQKPTTLASAKIEFDPALSSNAAFYKALQDVLVTKYGPIKGGDKDIERRILTWGTKEGVAQLTQHAKGPFTLSAPLAKQK